MSWGVLHGAMLLGLLGIAIPVIIHLLNRRYDPLVDWGAMQFLNVNQSTRRRFQLQEWLLMLLRMSLLALVALALARPFWQPREAAADAGLSAGRRDVVLIIDGSASMDRRVRGTTPRAEALAWARRFLARLGTGNSVAILLAKDHVVPLLDPPTFHHDRAKQALDQIKPSSGSSDLPSAVAKALRILERTENPSREIVILTDGQRFAWRPAEPARWALLREIQRRMPVPPGVWALSFGSGVPGDGANASVGPLKLSRGLVPPGLPVTVSTEIANTGPGALSRTAELLVDGQPQTGSAQVVGPLPAGGKSPVTFRAMIPTPGSHVLAVRLVPGDDSLPGDDESAQAIEVASALPVRLVDGEPGVEPLSGETDFVRAALAPAGDSTPQVLAKTITLSQFTSADLQGQRVLILANCDRFSPEQATAIESFLSHGGGVLVALGDRTDPAFANESLYRNGTGWLPARVDELKGDFARREAVARPAPRTFGAMLTARGNAESSALGNARLFAYWRLEPAAHPVASSVLAQLDSGDAWIIERSYQQGRVIVLAGPLDAEGGTLPVNPDFVPWIHELVFHLADSSASAQPTRPGETVAVNLDPAPPAETSVLPVRTPSGGSARATIVRSGNGAKARLDGADEPGIYRIGESEPYTYAVVSGDPREWDLAELDAAESSRLAAGWPLRFESGPEPLTEIWGRAGSGGRREIWRGLIIAALAGLCLEVWFTRRLVRGREQSP